MNTVLYDGSYAGLLTAIFEVYEYKIIQPCIVKESEGMTSLFGQIHKTITHLHKADRVLIKLKTTISLNAYRQFRDSFLSEEKGMEDHLLRYVQYVMANKMAENNYSHPDVLYVQQTSRKVYREKHRMEAFVRFQLTKDQLYYAVVQPDFNVLPLISKHFEDRYADQRWLIYDAARKYGIYYDLEKVEEVQMHFTTDLNNADERKMLYEENEELYQKLWQQYFSSVNIKARKNMKLHIQHMPKRYWKWLVEKKG